ncbi:hypothetical protein Leryth_002707 [Lithospermum erythrorhizon]|nr:hypothetical protein Leryth_002707 [Lithospermum erythrorhizon]
MRSYQLKERNQKGRLPLQDIIENIESANEQNSSKGLIRRFDSAYVLFSKVNELQNRTKFSANRSWRLLFQFYGLENRIPKQLITLDEKYIYHCLQMMHVSAVRAAANNLSSNMGIISNSLGSRENLEGSIYDCSRSSYTLTAGNESVIISAKDDEILGSISGSKSMMNILGSPLLKNFGDSDSSVNTGHAVLEDAKGGDFSEFDRSPGGSTVTSFQKVSNDIGVEDEDYGRVPMHERIISMSSSNSTFSDQSSSVSSNYICHAMLHCTWKDGFPRYIFSIDDRKDVYAANLYKVDFPDEQGLDYVYTFHSRPSRKLEYEIHECDSHIVGKMKVSTMVTLRPNNSEIAETQFVLFGSSDNCPGEMHTSNGPVVKNKTLRRKVSDVFRSDKGRTLSKVSGSSSVLEDTFWNPSEGSHNNVDPSRLKLTETDYIPNLELAAIIVKDHLPANYKKPKIGGWGLKFLKNSESGSRSPSLPSGCGACEHSECSASMDILVASGFHGGPRTRNGGPSSLIERFRSGGHCDCEGWDIECPLTMLSTGSKTTDISCQGDTNAECKTFDLFVQGSKQSIPTMKMTNIHDGLHYIHFQSDLSALQVFSIATAIIHSHSPSLKHRVYRNR